MASASFVQSSFLGGSWSAFMQGRVDHPKYPTAMARCLNAFPVEEGACVRRPGLREWGRTRSGLPGRVISFEFVESNPYTMEFTDGHLRFWAGRNLVTRAQLPVASISGTTQATVATTAAHGYSTGDQVLFFTTDAQSSLAIAPLLNAAFSVTVVDTMTFTLSHDVTGAAIPGFSTTNPNITVARVFDLATPYTAGSWQDIRAIPAQSNHQQSECFLLHPTMQPMLVTAYLNGPSITLTYAPASPTGPTTAPTTTAPDNPTGDAGGSASGNDGGESGADGGSAGPGGADVGGGSPDGGSDGSDGGGGSGDGGDGGGGP